MQKENLAVVKIEVGLVAVKTDLGSGLTEVVVEIVTLIAGAIKIGHKVVEEFVVFIQCEVSELEISGVAVVVGRVESETK